MAEDLPVGYYLDNFSYLLEFVSRQYADLLTGPETAFATGFDALSLDARRLYVRLSGRKGPLFREDKLSYPEIDDIALAVDELAVAGFLDFAEDAAMDDLLRLFTRKELSRFGEGAWPGSATREMLVSLCQDALGAEDIHARHEHRILRPLRLDVLQTYRLLFFGNLHQDFTEFVLHDLGISPFEQYPIDPETRFFNNRCVLEETLSLYGISDAASEAIEAGDTAAMIGIERLIPDRVEANASVRASRIRNRIARELERYQLAEAALAIYGRSGVAPGRERRARLLHKLGDLESSLSLCEEIIREPEDEAEYEFAIGFANRLLRKPVAAPQFNTFTARLPRDADKRVEEQARLSFEASGEEAWYVENTLFPGLFGLVFWDIIFHPVRGAFFNPFQRGPADLFSRAFRDTRRPLIEARFRMLEDPGALRELAICTLREKAPIANHFVHWGYLPEALVLRALERIPTEHLLKVFRRLLRDLKTNRAGLPDLVVFPASGGYRLVEVKGPFDTLQNNQKRWLRFFSGEGIPADVMRIEWQD